MNAFFIVPTSVKGAVQTLFATHPPMEKRIERAPAARGAAPERHRLAAVGFLDALLGGQEQAQGRRAGPAVRDDHGVRHDGDRRST